MKTLRNYRRTRSVEEGNDRTKLDLLIRGFISAEFVFFVHTKSKNVLNRKPEIKITSSYTPIVYFLISGKHQSFLVRALVDLPIVFLFNFYLIFDSQNVPKMNVLLTN